MPGEFVETQLDLKWMDVRARDILNGKSIVGVSEWNEPGPVLAEDFVVEGGMEALLT